MSDGGLFDLPEEPAVRPVKLSPAGGKIGWSEWRGHTALCEDCLESFTEWSVGDRWVAPLKPILLAGWVRTYARKKTYVCNQHAQLRKEYEDADRSNPDPG